MFVEHNFTNREVIIKCFKEKYEIMDLVVSSNLLYHKKMYKISVIKIEVEQQIHNLKKNHAK